MKKDNKLRHYSILICLLYFLEYKYVLDGLISFDGEGGARNFFLNKATITHAIQKQILISHKIKRREREEIEIERRIIDHFAT